MLDNNIISFADYLKRKKNRFSIDENFMESLSQEIKDRPEMIEWYSFQNTFNKHKLFLHRLFSENQREDNINPNAAYFLSFTAEQIDENVNKIINALKWLERRYVVVNASKCTFRDMAGQIYGQKPKNTHEAWLIFEDVLYNSNNVLVISNISKSKIASRKSWYARSIIKFNDDAHYKRIKPQSEILLVDDACFLQRSWSELGAYIEIFA